MKLIIARHGHSAFNSKDLMIGKSGADYPLSGTGRTQARALGKRLSRERVVAIYSSPIRRALETAREIARFHPGKKIAQEPLLAEIDFGDFEGLAFSSLLKKHVKKLYMHPVDPEYSAHGGETYRAAEKRAGKLLWKVHSKAKGAGSEEAVVLVTHGAFGKVLLAKALNLPIENCRIFWLSNASVSEITAHRHHGQPQLNLANDTSHLAGKV
ncbi:MAG: histidine phosphatase family protein [archaeon]